MRFTGTRVNNQYNQYPLIVYNNITYIPMTFNISRFLGLEAKWSEEEGLNIEKTNIFAEYKENKAAEKNSASYKASIPPFKITVNGKEIDNSKEKYPLLFFRNVTYFPLTWHFAVDEFKWEYEFDTITGLSIKSQNTSVEKLKLPFQSESISPVYIFDEYYYYVGENNDETYIYRAPISNPTNVSEVYNKRCGESYSVKFFNMGKELYFSYHIGTNLMGRYVYCRVNENGIGDIVISANNMFFKMLGNDMVILDYYRNAGTLYYKKSGEEKCILGESIVCATSDVIEIVDGWVYVKASKYEDGDYFEQVYEINRNDLYKIFKVNIETNETLIVSDTLIKYFTIKNDKIYFIKKEDEKLYTMTLDGEEEKVLINTPIKEYVIDEDTIYYISKESKELFKLNNNGTVESMLPDKKVYTMEVMENKLICKLEDNEEYGLVVFDNNGNEIFKTSDRVANANLEGNLLSYKVFESYNNYIVHLP